MIFKTLLAFALVAAISASGMTLLGGLGALGVYHGLAHFTVLASVPYFSVSNLAAFVVAVFALTLPIEIVYARRVFFSKERPSSAKASVLLLPVAVAVEVYSRLVDRRRGSE